MVTIKGRQYSTPAILIGNGINQYYNTAESWNSLLNELAKKYNLSLNLSDNDKSISTPEAFEQIMIHIFRKRKADISVQQIYKELKCEFCKLLKEDNSLIVKPLIAKASSIDNPFPILTTNYDLNLLTSQIYYKDSSVKKDKKPACVPGKKNFPRVYNFFNYYANTEYKANTYDCRKCFGIWHIHGIKCYKESLKISSNDYMSLITYMKKKFLKGNKQIWAPNSNEYSEWEARNSWLDIFFNNDLIIMGLALDVQELDLRWLLIERAKHIKARKLNITTIYYYTEHDIKNLFIKENRKNPNCKYLFFKSLGIDLIETSCKDLYEMF